ncbi:MAG: FprA family A-type flavoprotein, partial [Anaerovoracaceae bacterium]
MKIKENIYSVGVVDKDIRIFHGYETPVGTTYNAYLVIDDQVTLIDFVKQPFAEEHLRNIKEILGDRKVDNIISNHVEPDHSGSLPLILENYPTAKIYGTAACEKELGIYYPEAKMDFNVVGKGDTLNTGKYNFHFIPMPMVHWPDSMSTYLAEEKILFSNDALGQHIGTGEVFDTDISWGKLNQR